MADPTLRFWFIQWLFNVGQILAILLVWELIVKPLWRLTKPEDEE